MKSGGFFELPVHSFNAESRKNSPICIECGSKLIKSSTTSEDFVPSASRLCIVLADYCLYGESKGFRAVSLATADVICKALDSRESYFHTFGSEGKDDISTYKETHKNGKGIANPLNLGWFEEASQVRPNINFGATSTVENSRTCRKNYGGIRSHTPRIFTVVCVCRHPKLLGVSVMTKTEGVSTALSILLARFSNLSRVCYYDNGCNMTRSIVLRVPWIKNQCRLVYDRFHYAGHT